MKPTTSGTASLVDELTKRLFPAKATVLARAELLTSDNRSQAIAYLQECKAFETELSVLSEATLIALFEDEMESDRQRQAEKAQDEEKTRFFHDRSARADYQNWIHRKTWTVDEATALLLGKNPEMVDWRSMNPLVYKSSFAKRYEMLRKHLKAAREAARIQPPDTPAGFIRHAKAIGFVLPADLQSLLVARQASPDEAGAASGEKDGSRDNGATTFRQLIEQNRKGAPMDAEAAPSVAESTIAAMRQEREVLLKILGAIAMSRYGFDPDSDDTSITRSIVADLRKAGFPVNVASAHKLIGEAARWVVKEGGGVEGR